MRDLLLVGAGGLAREMALLARQSGAFRPVGFVGKDEGEIGGEIPGGRIVTSDARLLAEGTTAALHLAVGDPRIRGLLAARLAAAGRFEFPNLLHPTATLDPSVRFGDGNAVTAGVVFTCDVTVGRFNLFNLNATVGHDARIGDCNVVNPGVAISGGVTIGSRCLLGVGAAVLEGLGICDDVTIGAGAVVTRDISEPGTTWVGVPARPLRTS